MAIFENTPDEWQRLDYIILRDGWASLYWRQGILDTDISWFKNEGYKVVLFDFTKWSDLNRLHEDLKKYLRFPEYYGKNFNALRDCLSDIEITETGLLIVFQHFQSFEKTIALGMLDIFANSSREHILFGERLLTLVQADDPNYQIDEFGACSILWNRAEWFTADRKI